MNNIPMYSKIWMKNINNNNSHKMHIINNCFFNYPTQTALNLFFCHSNSYSSSFGTRPIEFKFILFVHFVCILSAHWFPLYSWLTSVPVDNHPLCHTWIISRLLGEAAQTLTCLMLSCCQRVGHHKLMFI